MIAPASPGASQVMDAGRSSLCMRGDARASTPANESEGKRDRLHPKTASAAAIKRPWTFAATMVIAKAGASAFGRSAALQERVAFSVASAASNETSVAANRCPPKMIASGQR